MADALPETKGSAANIAAHQKSLRFCVNGFFMDYTLMGQSYNL